MDGDPREIQDVLREEMSRGKTRRPIDTEARKERERLKRDYLRLILEGDEEAFVNALRALGLQAGSKEFEKHLKAWRDVRRSRRRPGGRRGA